MDKERAEREAALDAKIAAIKKANEERAKRFTAVEADKRNFDGELPKAKVLGPVMTSNGNREWDAHKPEGGIDSNDPRHHRKTRAPRQSGAESGGANFLTSDDGRCEPVEMVEGEEMEEKTTVDDKKEKRKPRQRKGARKSTDRNDTKVSPKSKENLATTKTSPKANGGKKEKSTKPTGKSSENVDSKPSKTTDVKSSEIADPTPSADIIDQPDDEIVTRERASDSLDQIEKDMIETMEANINKVEAVLDREDTLELLLAKTTIASPTVMAIGDDD